jgi:soluble lytic murein transglycosylase-like protein
VHRWASQIERWAAEYALPPDLIAVVMQIESCGDPLAVSPSGAEGLFQVMPYHFSRDDDPFDAETNAHRGLRYLAGAMSLASNDQRLALAGYNGGHASITLPESQWAAETQRYVKWGMGILQDARAGYSSSPTLAAWLASGGDHLCRQSAERLASDSTAPLQPES